METNDNKDSRQKGVTEMYVPFIYTRGYVGKESISTVTFELPEKEWEELENSEVWKLVEEFLVQKREEMINRR
ncbi:hypothetical protein LIQ95_11935 [[Ruminococcus] gnavus]|uniref:hypothetical protein n=1 Tax=Mediterraneibacter gnavus TaxID=33038 RepID=UPI001D0570B9|nr:hypothetical protein [Mediterraneibacter gnavus]MCB5652897.1 hypothetical protein [Mediterraneibacter gnavus]